MVKTTKIIDTSENKIQKNLKFWSVITSFLAFLTVISLILSLISICYTTFYVNYKELVQISPGYIQAFESWGVAKQIYALIFLGIIKLILSFALEIWKFVTETMLILDPESEIKQYKIMAIFNFALIPFGVYFINTALKTKLHEEILFKSPLFGTFTRKLTLPESDRIIKETMSNFFLNEKISMI